MNRQTHELTAEQSQVLLEVSRRMKLFAYLMIASPVVSFMVTFYQLHQIGASPAMLMGGTVMTVIGAVFYFIIAFFTITAASSLQSVVTSEGHDLPHFIRTFDKLKRLFGIQYWLIVISLLALVLWLVVAFSWVAFSV